jgi:hypothetical protein
MGHTSQQMGRPVCLSVDMPKATIPKLGSNVTNASNNITHIRSRVVISVKYEGDGALTIGFDLHVMEAAIFSKADHVVHSINFS